MPVSSLVRSLAVVALAVSPSVAAAGTVVDPTGDFLPSFVGDKDADLDVTLFSVNFDTTTNIFKLDATFAGTINPAKAGRYVVGVNTGTGVNAPFAGIGQPNVRFNQAFSVFKDGTVSLAGATATISGKSFSAFVPLSALAPSTGFKPGLYGWNLWPRNGGAGATANADFAPNNAMLAAVPEPATWAMLIMGFGLVGTFARRSRRAGVQTAG